MDRMDRMDGVDGDWGFLTAKYANDAKGAGKRMSAKSKGRTSGGMRLGIGSGAWWLAAKIRRMAGNWRH